MPTARSPSRTPRRSSPPRCSIWPTASACSTPAPRPGGKTTQILEQADVELVALDSDATRLNRVRENLTRLRLDTPRVTVREGDAGAPRGWWDGRPFDRILVDVPCTASGVVRRHPDGKWLRRARDVASFGAQQARLLDSLWGCLAPGGKLLYVTCSVFRDENDAQIDAFLARTPGALREIHHLAP